MLTLEVAHVIVAIVVVVVLIAAAALISWKSAINYHIKVGEAKVGSAEEKAREIIDDALKTAETKSFFYINHSFLLICHLLHLYIFV